MKILITGASGFLGGHCAEAFARHGDKVVAAVRPSSRVELLKSLGVTPRVASLNQHGELRHAMSNVDVVIHAAAKVEPYGRWRDFERVTIDGTRHVLQAAIDVGVRQFIYISSRGVYERPARQGMLYEETCPYGTPYHWSYYARAKIAAEKIVRDAQDKKLIATTIMRPTWLYGPRDTKIFVRVVSALRARRLRWIDDGKSLLNLVYITDAADAIVLAATHPNARGQVYNVANDENSVTQRQFLTRICELLALPLPTVSMSYRTAHNLGFLSECVAHSTGFLIRPPLARLSALLLSGQRRFSSQKLRTELGWKPTVSFEEGIRNTVEWFRTVQGGIR